MNLNPYDSKSFKRGKRARTAPFTAKQEKYIIDNRLLYPSRVLAEHLNCSKSKVQRFMNINGLKPGKDITRKFKSQAHSNTASSTSETDDILRREYLSVPVKRLANLVGRSDTFVRTRLRQLGLVVPREIIEKRKQDARFNTGSAPKNKGKKMTPEQYEKAKRTMFKKGIVPKNTKPDFSITIRKDKRGVAYKHIRIDKGFWIPYHRYVWINSNGPPPPGMKIVFKDGNTMNCKIENLEMVTAAELMLRNTVHNLPKPLAEVVQLRGAVNRQINKHLKKKKNEKQNQ